MWGVGFYNGFIGINFMRFSNWLKIGIFIALTPAVFAWEAIPRAEDSRGATSSSTYSSTAKPIVAKPEVYDARNFPARAVSLAWSGGATSSPNQILLASHDGNKEVSFVTNAASVTQNSSQNSELQSAATQNYDTVKSYAQAYSPQVNPTQTSTKNFDGNFSSGEMTPLDTLRAVRESRYSRDQREWIDHLPPASMTITDVQSSESSQTSLENPHINSLARGAVSEALPAISMEQNPQYRQFLPYTQRCGVVLIQADFPLDEIEAVTREIALLQEDLLLYLAVPSPREKIDLCLFKSNKSYLAFLAKLFPNAPTDRPALFIKRPNEPATLLVPRSGNFEIDLRHEMTHAILHARIEGLPMWIDEGLAKYLELPRTERPFGSPYLKTVKWQANLWMISSLKRLESLRDVNDMGTREYRDAWAWTHFLIHHSPQTHQLLASYLQKSAAETDRVRQINNQASNSPTQKNSPQKIAALQPLSYYLQRSFDNPATEMKKHFSQWKQQESSPAQSPEKSLAKKKSWISGIF